MSFPSVVNTRVARSVLGLARVSVSGNSPNEAKTVKPARPSNGPKPINQVHTFCRVNDGWAFFLEDFALFLAIRSTRIRHETRVEALKF